MSVRLNPTSQIMARLGIDEGGKAHKFLTQRCKDYMEKYVPMRDNILRQVVDLQAGRIIYLMPYAKYQYRGIREDGTHKVEHYTTPGTGPYWDRRMVAIDMPKIIEEVDNYIKRGY